MKTKIFSIIVFAVFMVGCASRPDSIPASYVSHEKYVDNDCQILYNKLSNAQTELRRVSDLQNSAANSDAVGVFLLGIPFSKLSGDHAGDVAKWKGEIEAIETAKIKKKCDSTIAQNSSISQNLSTQPMQNKTIEEKFKELNNLKKDGILTEEEYQSKKRELISKI